MTEPNPTEVMEKLAALSSLRSFLKSPGVTLVGLRVETKYPKIAGHDVAESFAPLMMPALVAAERGVAVLSDDQMFRLFSTPLKTLSFSTQAFLRAAKSKGLINEDAYDDAVLSLHSWNYHFVSHNAQTLIRLFKRTAGPPDDLAKSLFNMVSRPGWGTQSSRRVLVGFYTYLWSKAPRSPQNLFQEWSISLWLAVLDADKTLKFAFGFIADLAALLSVQPFIFGLMMTWFFEHGPGSLSVKKRLLRSAKAVTSVFSSKTSPLAHHSDLHRKWQRQLKTFEMFELMWGGLSK